MAKTAAVKSVNAHSGLNWKAVVAGTVLTLMLTVITSGTLALVVYLTDISESMITGTLYYLGILMVAVGSMFAARWAESLGWLHGALAALLYVSLAVIISSLFFASGPPSAAVAQRLVVAMVVGGLSGVIGLNF